jgi:hypothetical protein
MTFDYLYSFACVIADGGVSEKYLAATFSHIQQKKGSWFTDIAQKIVALDQ